MARRASGVRFAGTSEETLGAYLPRLSAFETSSILADWCSLEDNEGWGLDSQSDGEVTCSRGRSLTRGFEEWVTFTLVEEPGARASMGLPKLPAWGRERRLARLVLLVSDSDLDAGGFAVPGMTGSRSLRRWEASSRWTRQSAARPRFYQTPRGGRGGRG